ncbi:hypothetical protein E5288_WYG015472 [Bos mutus]|uniref:Uncharacterized protein n=1 Tax=Bos mutus TaxID=72004 RepID=A0A6B0S954_9CETA|nr:hypothetical protein [Bos mutus]
MDTARAVTWRPQERLDPPVVGGTVASASEVEGIMKYFSSSVLLCQEFPTPTEELKICREQFLKREEEIAKLKAERSNTKRPSDGSLSHEEDLAKVVELQEVIDKQSQEQSQMKEHLATLSAHVTELEEDLDTARKDLLKSEDMNTKLQRDVHEDNLNDKLENEIANEDSMHRQTEDKNRQLQECLELVEKLQQTLWRAETLPEVEAELTQRVAVLSKAGERHGNIEERLRQMEAQLEKKNKELQRKGTWSGCGRSFSVLEICVEVEDSSSDNHLKGDDPKKENQVIINLETLRAELDQMRLRGAPLHHGVKEEEKTPPKKYAIKLPRDLTSRLEIENVKLQTTVKKQVGKIEQLQKNLLSTRSSEDEKEQLKKYFELKQSLENSLDQEKKKNSEFKKEITGFKKLLKMTRRKLNEYENGELSFHGDLKTSQTEMDIQINMLKHKIGDLTAELETASSKCLHLDAKNQVLQEELLSMKGMQKKCEKLEKNTKKLEQELVLLRSHIEMKMIEHSQVEQYKQEIEERVRQDLVEKLKEVNLFLQVNFSWENLEQLQEKNNASIRSQMELRIKDLESELSKVKTLQEDSHKAELEKYKQLYLVELEVRKSLEGKLYKTHERLAVISTKLEVEKEQNKSLLEPLCVGNFNNPLVLNGNLTLRANVRFSTSIPCPSNNSMENYLTKITSIIFSPLTAAEFESESYGLSPLGATDGSNLDKVNRTALHLVCANGHSAVVTLLLERKCLLNLCDNENRTALMKAIECQEEECATLLLEHGADPNVMDVCGNTALHYAVFCQNISLAAKLLFCDANIEARNKDDLTPLLLVICERRGQMVEFLVKKEANIHVVDKMKRTALMLVVKYESANVIRLLIQQGADIYSQDDFGWTAEEYAVVSGFNIFRQLISEYKEKRSKTSPENSNPDLSREHLEMITEEEQETLDEDENNHAQVEEEKKHKSSEVEVSENLCDAADESRLFQQRKSGGNSNQEFPAM